MRIPPTCRRFSLAIIQVLTAFKSWKRERNQHEGWEELTIFHNTTPDAFLHRILLRPSPFILLMLLSHWLHFRPRVLRLRGKQINRDERPQWSTWHFPAVHRLILLIVRSTKQVDTTREHTRIERKGLLPSTLKLCQLVQRHLVRYIFMAITGRW